MLSNDGVYPTRVDLQVETQITESCAAIVIGGADDRFQFWTSRLGLWPVTSVPVMSPNKFPACYSRSHRNLSGQKSRGCNFGQLWSTTLPARAQHRQTLAAGSHGSSASDRRYRQRRKCYAHVNVFLIYEFEISYSHG